jgi:hypothetical protein
MKIYSLSVGFMLIITQYGNGQIPAPERLTDWSRAGIQTKLPTPYHQISFEGDTTGVVNNSSLLQSILDTLTQPTLLLFGSGIYFFSSSISLANQTILKGLGNSKTHFLFNLGGAPEPAIEIKGTESGSLFPLSLSAAKGTYFIELTGSGAINFPSGSFFRLIQDDADLVNDSWGETRTGQLQKVDSAVGSKLYFSSPLRMDYPLSRNPRIRKVNPKRFSGIECIKLTRADNSNSGVGSSNILIRSASDCWVSSIESIKCNYAHIESTYSTNLLIENNYFYDSHGFGSDGRGYGVMLYYATGEVLVQNNIFRRLRHAMILQAGANGNVFAYNYAYEGRKEILPGFFITGEDLVCHGNYPYLNLFEGNYAQFASVDNSHGKNGPFNTYFRNLTNSQGFRVTSSVSPFQNITGNLRTAGSSSFSSTNHHITDNSWQAAGVLTHKSLVYQEEPAFLSGFGLGKIGPPAFNVGVSIPARERALSQNYINNTCDIIIWENGQWNSPLTPSQYTKNYRLKLLSPEKIILKGIINLKNIDAAAGTMLEVEPGGKVVLHKEN